MYVYVCVCMWELMCTCMYVGSHVYMCVQLRRARSGICLCVCNNTYASVSLYIRELVVSKGTSPRDTHKHKHKHTQTHTHTHLN
jgi:hypothetical protein